MLSITTEFTRLRRKKIKPKKMNDTSVRVKPIPPPRTQELEREKIEMEDLVHFPEESSKIVNDDSFTIGIIIVHSLVPITEMLSLFPSHFPQCLVAIPFQCPSSQTMWNKYIKIPIKIL